MPLVRTVIFGKWERGGKLSFIKKYLYSFKMKWKFDNGQE